jgi:hypothetical protein
MEVHHHTHAAAGGTSKKWHHYFWEFFMLFLAVTLGFFVENQREHIVEHKRELQFTRSFIKDLDQDISQLDSLIRYSQRKNVMIDSLSYLLDTPDVSLHGRDIYYYARLLTIIFNFFNTDRTIQQLKNGGNLRLIQKQKVSDAIMDYDRQVRFIEDIHTREEEYVRDYRKWLEETCDGRVFNKMTIKGFGFTRPDGNPELMKTDKQTLIQFITKIHFLRSANTFKAINYGKLKQTAQQTVDLIKKEYHFE